MSPSKKPFRVTWTERERNAFIDAAVTFGYPQHGDSSKVWKQAIQKSGVRDRPIDPAFMAKVNKKRRVEALRPPEVKGLPQQGPVTVVERKEEVAEVPAPSLPAPPEEPTDPFRPVVEQVSEGLAAILVESLTRALYDTKLRAAFRNIVSEVLAPESELARVEGVTWRSTKTPRERLPRIVVAGGRTSLRETLSHVKNVDLRLWGQVQGESPHRLWNLLKEADECFVMVKDISHPVMHSIKAREKRHGSPALKVNYWTDSAAELAAAINDIAQGIAPKGDGS